MRWVKPAEEHFFNTLETIEQCVCYFEKVLEGTSADFTLHLQKEVKSELETEFASEAPLEAELQKLAENEDLYKAEIEKFEMLKLRYPEGLDIVVFLTDSEEACGLNPE